MFPIGQTLVPMPVPVATETDAFLSCRTPPDVNTKTQGQANGSEPHRLRTDTTLRIRSVLPGKSRARKREHSFQTDAVHSRVQN